MQKKEYYKHNLPHFQQPGQAYFVTWSLKDAVPKHALKHLAKKMEILKSQIDSGLAIFNSPIYNRGMESAKPRGLANSNSPFASGSRELRFATGSESPIGIGETRKEKSRLGDRETQKNEKLQKEYNILRKRYIKVYNDLLDAERKPKINLCKPENLKVLFECLNFWEGKKLKNHAFCIMPNHVHWVFELLEKDEEGKLVYLQDVLYSVKRFSATHVNKLEKRTGSLWQKESFDTTIRDEKHLYYTIEYTLNNPVNAGFVKNWKKWDGCRCRE